MPKLSLCMIVKNEAQHLERCLNSVKNLVDEIIIVDTGSTDKTKEIAAKFTNKIYDFSWCDDFAAARNESLKHAKGDWILVLDADETISEQDHQLIQELLKDEADAFMLTQRTYTDTRNFLKFISAEKDNYTESKAFSGWTPAKIVRLFRNNQGFIFSGRVHESIVPSVTAKSKLIKEVSVPIHHFSDLNSRKKELYQKLGDLELQENPTPAAQYEAARRCLIEQNYAEAKVLLEKAKQNDSSYAPLYPLLIYIYAQEGDLAKAEDAFSLARLYEADPRSSVLNQAIAYEKSKMPDKALNLIHNFGFASNDFAPMLYLMGKCYHALGNYLQAAKYLAKVVEKDKQHFNAQTLLIDSFLRMDHYPAAQDALQYALDSSHPQSTEFRAVLQQLQTRSKE